MNPLRGLYAITPNRLQGAALFAAVGEALRGGARLVQYRDKSTDRQRRLDEAQQLRQLCSEYDALFIINDDIDLALQVDAAGVHLGRDDARLAMARKRLGRGKLIGVSCYDDWQRAVEQAEQGADYIAFGAFFPSATKPRAARASRGLLERAATELPLPVVAIGGITPENAQPLITSGADMVALIDGLFAQPDIRHAARAISRLFKTTRGAA